MDYYILELDDFKYLIKVIIYLFIGCLLFVQISKDFVKDIKVRDEEIIKCYCIFIILVKNQKGE